MKTINRTVITIKGKKPYVDWANSFDDGGPKISKNDLHTTAYLIPDTYDEFNYENFLKKNFKTIFDSELESWMTDPRVWPRNRTYKDFKRWFYIQISDLAFDLAKDDLITEE
jgi:hypothetical protein